MVLGEVDMVPRRPSAYISRPYYFGKHPRRGSSYLLGPRQHSKSFYNLVIGDVRRRMGYILA